MSLQHRRDLLKFFGAALPVMGSVPLLADPAKPAVPQKESSYVLHSPEQAKVSALTELSVCCDLIIRTGPIDAIVLAGDPETTRHVLLMNSLNHINIRSFGAHPGGTRFWQLYRTCGKPRGA